MCPANVVGGIVYVCLSFALFLLNLLVLTILTFKEYASITYRIIKNMCVACLLQLIVFFIGALMTFHGNTFNSTFEKVLGAVVQATWILYISLSLTLAIDRMLTFVSSHLSSFVSYLLLTVSWIHGTIHFVLLLLPDFTVAYCIDKGWCYMWDYDQSPGSKKMDKIIAYVLLALEFSSLCCYIVVLYRLVKLQMKKFSNSTGIVAYKVELRILSVSVLSFLYESSLITFLTWGREILPDAAAKDIAINVVWMLDSGLFSVATIVINTSLRRKLLSLFRVPKKNVTVVTTIPLTHSRIEPQWK
ncbi:hypothetical protein QR680_016465 [Steinernema hermaphroditum]|uniref:Uncharacterized protein n=1 Tax=Steinernema hermaphroditum TaxID=289476 RepID=A0AA39HBA8_9BILA|nr:hypothetical protein QR680_016465 [Steinernema hermaphroditum]